MKINDIYDFWFYSFETIGAKGRENILELYGSVEESFLSDKKKLVGIFNKKQMEELITTCNVDLLEDKIGRLKDRNIEYILFNSDKYPVKLNSIYEPPGILYLRGHLSDTVNSTSRNIAIVGSRKADAYGRELARIFARELSLKGVNIISGLALGVDGQAHRGALNANGYTLGVLGSGINVTYPKNNIELYEEMAVNGGIISEHYLDIPPMPQNFPRRNRIISALSDGVLVVCASKKSGSLITADYALEQGKQVYAIPGRLLDENSEGTNNLIKQGAICVTEPEDILMDLYGTVAIDNKEGKEDNSEDVLKTLKLRLENNLAPLEKMVYSCLSLNPIYIDTIVNMLGISVTDTINILYSMENKGVIKQTSKGYYILAI